MNSTLLLALLILFCFLVWNADIAMAADIQTAPLVQSVTSSPSDAIKPSNVGPRDPNKEKSHGVGVNVFLNKNMAVSGSVSLLAPEPSALSGQPDPAGVGGFGLRPSQVGGTVAFKMFF